jgi:hypothetical protein
MARIITKEHAVKIAKKLKAKIREEKAHTYAEIFYDNRLIAWFGIRRGSEKDKGHDHIQKDLHINGYQAKMLAACPLTLEDWLEVLEQKNLLP